MPRRGKSLSPSIKVTQSDNMNKRAVSVLIPYCLKQKDLYVFLQRRTADAPSDPNTLGSFGGGLEVDESNEEGLIRELQEELEYTPKDYEELGIFENDNSVVMAYIEKVPEDFETMVIVHEGEGGEWHKAVEVIEDKDLAGIVLQEVKMMIEKLHSLNN